MAIGPDVVRKLTVQHSAPGADEAAAKTRAVGAALKESAGSGDLLSRSLSGVESMMAKTIARAEAEVAALKKNEAAQRALNAANEAALDGVRAASRLTAASTVGSVTAAVNSLATAAPYAAKVVTSTLAPALTIVAQESTKAGLVMAQELLPALGAIAKELSPVLAPLAALAVGYLAASAAISAMVGAAGSSLRAFQEFQDSQVKLQSNLKLTGGAAGLTAGEIETLVERIGDIKNTREAADALVKLGTLSGTSFTRTLELAKDLSAEGFGGMTESAKALAKALSNPEEGLKALDSVGIHFSATQRAMYQDMVNTGRGIEAQKLILDDLQKKIGGAGAAKEATVSGAYSNLSDALKISAEQFGEQIATITHLAGAVQILADALALANKSGGTFKTILPYLVAPQNAAGTLLTQTAAGLFNAYRSRPTIDNGGGGSGWGGANDNSANSAAALQAQNALQAQQAQRIGDVTAAIQKEIDALQKTDLQKAIDVELIKAQVAANSDEAAKIAELVKQRELLKDPPKADYLADFNEKLKDLAGSAGEAGEEIVKLGKLADLGKSFDAAKDALDKADIGIAEYTDKLKTLTTIYQAARQAILSPPDDKDESNGYTRLIQSTKDRIEELNFEAASANKTSAAILGLKAAHELERAATKAGVDVTAEMRAEWKRLGDELTAAEQKLKQARAQSDATFNLQTVFLSDTERQVADLQKSLHGDYWQKFTNDGLSATVRLTAGLKELNSAAGTFASGFIKDIDNGVAPMQALAAQAKNLAQNLIDIASKQVASNLLGSLVGNLGQGASQSATTSTAGATWIAAGATFNEALIAAATSAAGIMAGAGAETAAPIVESGTLTGAEWIASGQVAATELEVGGAAAGTAILGPLALVMAAIAAAGALVYGLTKGPSQSDIRAQQKANSDAKSLLAQLNGSGGSLSTQVAGLSSQTNSAVIALGGKNQALAWQLINATNDAITKAQADFIAGWQGTIDALKAGLGDNSPFSQARANVENLAKSINDFVANTQFAAEHGGAPTGNTATSIQQAQEAGRQALLSMLQITPALSDVQKEIQNLNGTSSALGDALQHLGASSDQAAKAINDGVTAALAQLSATFQQSLTERLNTALGKDFLNSFITLFAQHAQDLQDAASLGGGSLTGLANQTFGAEAQKIVNDAQLTGAAFDALLVQFPQLTGVVTAFSAAAQGAANAVTRSADDIASTAQSLNDRLLAATTDQNTLAGKLIVFDQNAQEQRLAEQAKGGQESALLDQTLAAERLALIKQDGDAQLQLLQKQADAEAQAQQAALQRSQGFADQLFALQQDQTTLQGQLAVFDLQAQRDREAEVASGGQALVDLEALQSQRRLDIITKFNQQAVDATEQALTEAQNFLSSFTANVKSYLKGLTTGNLSPLSPLAQLNAAQATYNADYTTGLSGSGQAQRDALNVITQDFSTLLNAARGYYGSSSPYQSIYNSGVSQLNALPSQVDAATLIVNAVNTASTANTSTLTAVQNVLQTAIIAGNAANTAAALLPSFNTLTATTGGVLTQSQFNTAMQAQLHGMASDAQLSAMFKTLDVDNSGTLSKLDLINVASGAIKTSTDAVGTGVNNVNTGVGTGNALTGTTNSTLGALQGLQGTTNAVLNSISGLQSTQTTLTSTISQNQLTGNALLDGIHSLQGTEASLQDTANALSGQVRDNIASSNSILQALQTLNTTTANSTSSLIDYTQHNVNVNLGGIRSNTARFWDTDSNQPITLTSFAKGGLVDGGVPGRDSVRAMLMPGEWVNTTATVDRMGQDFFRALDRGFVPALPVPVYGAANDNGGWREVVAEIRRLHDRIAQFEDRLVRLETAVGEELSERLDRIGTAVSDGVREAKNKAA